MTAQLETTAAPPAAQPQWPSNVHGRMTGLTLFTPIRSRWLPVLKAAFWLGKYVPLAAAHILKFDFIHFVRWTVIRELPYDGPPQPKRDRLNYSYLFFESNFDGPWQPYIDAFAYVIPKDIRFVWGRGINFPGPPPAEPLKRWIAENSREGGTYYSAYPDADVKTILASFDLRDALRSFVATARSLPPEEFKAAYERFLTDVQHAL